MKNIALVLCVTVIVSYCTSATASCDPDYSVYDIANGTVSCSNGNTVNSTCSFACHDGFYVSGFPNLTCGDQGQWDYSAPTCVEGTCDPHSSQTITISPIDGPGEVTCDEVTSVCELECLNGTVIRNQSISLEWTCNGTFRDVKLQCGPIDSCLALGCITKSVCQLDAGHTNCTLITEHPVCGEPDFSAVTLENGDVSCSNSNKYRSTCKFTCNTGYFMNGNMTSQSKQCVDDGSGVNVVWDNTSVPMCQGASSIMSRSNLSAVMIANFLLIAFRFF